MKLPAFKKKYLLVILIPIVIAIIAVGAYIYKLNSQIQRPEEKNVEIATNEQATTEEAKEEDPSYDIALFGLDARDRSLDKGNRSDVVMVAHVNPETKKIQLYSIYRDSYVEIPNKGMDKLTHAYSSGGYELSLGTLNTNYDLNISKFVTVNFVALEDAIDLLGGVDVNIESNEIKYVNGYMRSLYRECGLNNVQYIWNTGMQTLTGAQAVAYCRIRYTSGGDIKRAQRQRTVLNAMFDKVKNTDLTTLNSIIDQMTKEIYTNLKTSEILELAKDVGSYEIEKSEGFPYNYKETSAMCVSDSKNKLSVVVPTNYLDDVITLHKEVYGQEDYEPSDKVQELAGALAGYQVPPTTEEATTENDTSTTTQQ